LGRIVGSLFHLRSRITSQLALNAIPKFPDGLGYGGAAYLVGNPWLMLLEQSDCLMDKRSEVKHFSFSFRLRLLEELQLVM